MSFLMLFLTIPMNIRIIVIQLRPSAFQLDIKNKLINFLLREFPIESLDITHKTVLIGIDGMLVKKALKIRIGPLYIILTYVT